MVLEGTLSRSEHVSAAGSQSKRPNPELLMDQPEPRESLLNRLSSKPSGSIPSSNLVCRRSFLRQELSQGHRYKEEAGPTEILKMRT